ncbi:endonuclease domain-containing protein [Microbacterium sp. P04]|uniref:endonuclease domain-containing protein n=1 Tax=Microbacterium sp. P04 TaxID=3366947 RepID=UPI00374665A3
MTVEILHRADLFALGLGRRAIDAALETGALIRARRDHYLPGDAPDELVRAARVGGRLTCLSLLALLDVFVLTNARLHVHLPSSASRMRSPHDRRRQLEGRGRRGVRLHWVPVGRDPDRLVAVTIVDALVHSARCQAPRAFIASIDSALNQRLISVADVAEIFRRLPRRFSSLMSLVDGRAESGPETLMRLMLRTLGCTVELQVSFDGIGRVDLLVNGWLVIECDSERYHSDWAVQEKDRRRDLALAARGFTPLRPTAAMIMWQPEMVLAAVRGILAARR